MNQGIGFYCPKLERERERLDGCSSVGKLPNGDQLVMASTPTFHSGRERETNLPLG